MEIIDKYAPILENEVTVDKKRIGRLFRNGPVYVFGYGSLLYPEGWLHRGCYDTKYKNMRTAVLRGYERGPFAYFGEVGKKRVLKYASVFYGIVRNKAAWLNGAVVKIGNSWDWLSLMSTEAAAGIAKRATYRIVDVTSEIEMADVEKNATVHAVVNIPSSKTDVKSLLASGFDIAPAPGYFDRVYKGVAGFHSSGFMDDFLATDGLKNNQEAKNVIRTF